MLRYVINLAGGNEIECRSIKSAKAYVRRYWPEAAIGHDGDLSDGGDRTYCWADDASAVNDDGRRAIATIRRIERDD